MKEIWLIRHGETAWTISGAHTGTTDIRLTERGREQAAAIRQALVGHDFELVLVSPLTRARETCELAGYGDVAIVDPNLAEWNYGDFEGKTTNEIREQIRDWSVWDHGVVQGETIDQVAKRAAAVIQRATMAEGNVAFLPTDTCFEYWLRAGSGWRRGRADYLRSARPPSACSATRGIPESLKDGTSNVSAGEAL